MRKTALRMVLTLATALQALPALSQQVSTAPAEVRCMGFIREKELPIDLWVAGTEIETRTFLAESSLVYLDGPSLRSARIGDVFQVVRATGKVRDRLTTEAIGVYYREKGMVRIDAIRPEGATGTVLMSCDLIFKGDQLVPVVNRPVVAFKGELSDRNTPFPKEGLASSIVLGKEDLREMAAGHFCFIAVGSREGVKPGDRFTIYRPQPPFDPQDLSATGAHSMTSYESFQTRRRLAEVIDVLSNRRVPPRVVGDILIVDVGETTSAAKIIYSRSEVHLGDIVVRR